jgi:hypothetical protein
MCLVSGLVWGGLKSQDGLDFSEVGNEIEKGCDRKARHCGAGDERDEIDKIDK